MTIKEALNTGTFIDVREPFEYQMQQANGAINIPLGLITMKAHEIAKMKKPILLYCQSGNRSGQAEMILRQHGIKEAYNIGGVADVIQLQKTVAR